MGVEARGSVPLALSLVVVILVLLIIQTQAKQNCMVKHYIFISKTFNNDLMARDPAADKFSTLFTSLYIVDNPLTEGPELNSTLVCRVQGLIGFAAQKETASLMGLSYVFTDGKFNGSTLIIVTMNPILIPDREFPIIGGIGLFRFARGVANVRTVLLDPVAGIATIEYNNWHDTIPSKPADIFGNEKVTKLHFYFHDTISGNNPTGVVVARAPTTAQSSTAFGLLAIIDNPLTEGPEITSKLIELASLMALCYVFVDDKFNGNTISIVTRNPIMNPVREFAVVGVTGLFRFARGFANVKTYWASATTGDAIVEYNSIIHQIQAQKVDWSEFVPYKELFHKKVTRQHFYFHDTVTPTTNQSSTIFGTLQMIDDPLTKGSDPSSKVVDQLSLIAAINYVFTDEKLMNGSSLSLLSHNSILNPVRELAIVGGTGSFRFASGFAQIKTFYSILQVVMPLSNIMQLWFTTDYFCFFFVLIYSAGLRRLKDIFLCLICPQLSIFLMLIWYLLCYFMCL
ncbi:hypothetical protein MKX01_029943 [Papaver californicum]|nr:hypothetical protein MKX01_006348 [Papaver californicum]KAI3951680.1 hypothetical protein MKX01_029943 [Papaver californicum]